MYVIRINFFVKYVFKYFPSLFISLLLNRVKKFLYVLHTGLSIGHDLQIFTPKLLSVSFPLLVIHFYDTMLQTHSIPVSIVSLYYVIENSYNTHKSS